MHFKAIWVNTKADTEFSISIKNMVRKCVEFSSTSVASSTRLLFRSIPCCWWFQTCQRQEDNQGTFSVFESSWHLSTTLSLFMLTVKQDAVNTNFFSLWFDPTVNRTLVYRFNSRHALHLTIDRLKCDFCLVYFSVVVYSALFRLLIVEKVHFT